MEFDGYLTAACEMLCWKEVLSDSGISSKDGRVAWFSVEAFFFDWSSDHIEYQGELPIQILQTCLLNSANFTF